MSERFVVTTYNLWTNARWPEREAAVRGYLDLTRPDVLCVQELQSHSREVIDQTLTGHARVHDDFEGWSEEGNIWWSNDLFDLVEHGAEDLGQLSPQRRLFWVRLNHRRSGRTVLVSTAHLTWQGNPREQEEGLSPRVAETRRTIEHLDRLAGEQEPVLFMGDLNDSANVIRRLRAADYVDSFTASGSPLAPTHPARPTANGTPQVLDWQFHRGPIRAMTSHVGEWFLDELAPSDHKPVVATYGLDV
ncbi:MAG TPA: endonuclease/exonuclease/phosphatase family protein [Candidatus Avipropionibacterium avicola]|uniref:Endonuclease/exonuclease/phosphatase family protein n=1 Tax=Candidatus Avipropionibacterium avicola TaxID=2840701 RepID=A0A9D1H175_9ACTN|nr:endonuclease/exonuclease/phosphatase family protein [Candidatus Avipropionibacterium avicola]